MNKQRIIIFLCIFGFIIGGSKIFAQSQEPTVTYACEGKSGVLMGMNDGWSNRTECKGENQRVVRLGNQGPNGTGNIMFIYRPAGDSIFVLTTDGKIYSQSNNQGWIIVPSTDQYYPNSLPADVPATSVAQWMLVHLLDNDGNVWLYDRLSKTWINIGHP